uniref:Fibronectin type-III domain-containing protein n=1 Tax=Tetraodon nigroviridis TaxID=99883 RepID=H3C2E5_TETNG
MVIRRSCALVVLLLWLDASALASNGTSPPGLLCVNDYISTLSCAWRGAAPARYASCSITGKMNIWIRNHRSCRLEQQENSPPGCSFAFENQTFNAYTSIPSIRMECDGAVVEELTDYKPHLHVKMNPPGAPVVEAAAEDTWVRWGAGGPGSTFTRSQFHAQIKGKDQPWEEARNFSTEDPQLKVSSQQFPGLCEVRVRVRPAASPNQHWSSWSPTTSWLAATEAVEAQPGWFLAQMGLLCSLGIIFVIILLLSAGYLRKRVLKEKPVPNPSKYFRSLQTLYEGNLKAWLNPAEAFFTAQLTDGISTVEVCEALASPPSVSAPAPSAGPDTGGNAVSRYTNMGYFRSSSCGSPAPAVRGPAYFTYPDDGDSGNDGIAVSLCSSFGKTESLEPEPQSPDSGFGFRKEDEEEKEDPEAPEETISPLLVFFFQHPSPSPPLSPCHLSSGDPADGGSICRSSSMNAQPCRTGYLTLKELHMTFSNKSI